MRSASVLVPCGGLIAAVGISLPILTVGVQAPDSLVPGLTKALGGLPSRGFGTSADQRLYLYAAAVVAVGSWLLPKVQRRTKPLGVGLALTSLAVVAFAAYRGWRVATEGPAALVTDRSSFLERAALDLLRTLHSSGILLVRPAVGLWILTAGAAILTAGVVLMFRRSGGLRA